MEKTRGKSSTGSPSACDVILNVFRCFSRGGGSRREPLLPLTVTLPVAAKVQGMNPKQDGAELPVRKQPVPAEKVIPSDEPPIVSQKSESLRPQLSDIEIRFSSYIDRAKSRLRRMPSAGGGGKHQAKHVKHVADDRFTDYINRAGSRLRSSSSNGREK